MLRIKKSILADAFILSAIGAFFLSRTWQKWANPIVDFGREVYIPWRINEGEVLYKDLNFLFGAFPPYWNALLFKVIGPSLLTLTIFNIFISSLNTALIYRFFYRTFGRLTAFVTAASFLIFFVFNQYYVNSNTYYIAPYSHSYFYAIFFTLCSLNLVEMFFSRPGKRTIIFLGIATGLILLSRLEIFIAFIIPLVCGLIVYFQKSKTRIPEVRNFFLLFICSLILIPVGFVVYFSQYFPWQQALAHVIGYNPQWKLVSQLIFYKRMSGCFWWQSNIFAIGKVLCIYLLTYCAFNIYSLGAAAPLTKNAPPRKYLFILPLAFTLIFIVSQINDRTVHDIFRAQYLFLLVITLHYFKQFRAEPSPSVFSRSLCILIFCSLSIILTMKAPLISRFAHYSLVYWLPATLLSIAFLTHFLPTQAEQKYRLGWLVQSFVLTMLLISGAVFSTFSLSWFNAKTKKISSGANTIWTFDRIAYFGFGSEVEQFLSWARQNIKPEETYVAFPEGSMLNFLTKNRMSGSHVSFMPAERATYSEESMLESLVQHPPDYFIFVYRDMTSYGFRMVGEDYGYFIDQWIQKNYREVWIVKDNITEQGFAIKVFKKIS